MGFVLKKTVRVRFEKDAQAFTLIMRRVKLEKTLGLLNEHLQKINDARDEAVLAGRATVTIPVKMLSEVQALVRGAAVGWEGIVDEEGKEVPFSPENFDEVFGYDLEFFTAMLNALMGTTDYEASEKNALTSSESAVH